MSSPQEQQNEFLNEVKQDYNKYYGYIVKQKEQIHTPLVIPSFLEYVKDW